MKLGQLIVEVSDLDKPLRTVNCRLFRKSEADDHDPPVILMLIGYSLTGRIFDDNYYEFFRQENNSLTFFHDSDEISCQFQLSNELPPTFVTAKVSICYVVRAVTVNDRPHSVQEPFRLPGYFAPLKHETNSVERSDSFQLKHQDRQMSMKLEVERIECEPGDRLGYSVQSDSDADFSLIVSLLRRVGYKVEGNQTKQNPMFETPLESAKYGGERSIRNTFTVPQNAEFTYLSPHGILSIEYLVVVERKIKGLKQSLPNLSLPIEVRSLELAGSDETASGLIAAVEDKPVYLSSGHVNVRSLRSVVLHVPDGFENAPWIARFTGILSATEADGVQVYREIVNCVRRVSSVRQLEVDVSEPTFCFLPSEEGNYLLPPTLKGKNYEVSYYCSVHAGLNRPASRTKRFVHAPHLPLNHTQSTVVNDSRTMTVKSIGGKPVGKLQCEMLLNKHGFVAGETIEIGLQTDNDTNRKVARTELTLVRFVTLNFAEENRSKVYNVEENVTSHVSTDPALRKAKMTIPQSTTPTITKATLDCITIEYEVRCLVKLKGYSEQLQFARPIIIAGSSTDTREEDELSVIIESDSVDDGDKSETEAEVANHSGSNDEANSRHSEHSDESPRTVIGHESDDERKRQQEVEREREKQRQLADKRRQRAERQEQRTKRTDDRDRAQRAKDARDEARRRREDVARQRQEELRRAEKEQRERARQRRAAGGDREAVDDPLRTRWGGHYPNYKIDNTIRQRHDDAWT